MNMEEVNKLLIVISGNYSQQMPKTQIEMDIKRQVMLEALKDYPFQLIYNNLIEHMKKSNFIPSIAELVNKPKEDDVCRPYIPNALETKQRYLELEHKVEPIKEEELEELKKRMEKSIKEAKKANEQRIAKLFAE